MCAHMCKQQHVRTYVQTTTCAHICANNNMCAHMCNKQHVRAYLHPYPLLPLPIVTTTTTSITTSTTSMTTTTTSTTTSTTSMTSTTTSSHLPCARSVRSFSQQSSSFRPHHRLARFLPPLPEFVERVDMLSVSNCSSPSLPWYTSALCLPSSSRASPVPSGVATTFSERKTAS
eukprot:GHVS01021126.1.p2 GENE.GHVS01021126.1~~GHVS01021126.1.p2  ORF type:complete len:174 (-),score=43.04 GHVS01021126.1:736-1257(-)